MRDLSVLLLHLLVTVARLAGPGGMRSVVAESVLVKQQLLIRSDSCPRPGAVARVFMGATVCTHRLAARLLRRGVDEPTQQRKGRAPRRADTPRIGCPVSGRSRCWMDLRSDSTRFHDGLGSRSIGMWRALPLASKSIPTSFAASPERSAEGSASSRVGGHLLARVVISLHRSTARDSLAGEMTGGRMVRRLGQWSCPRSWSSLRSSEP